MKSGQYFNSGELPAGPDPKKPANVDFLCRSLQEESVDCIIPRHRCHSVRRDQTQDPVPDDFLSAQHSLLGRARMARTQIPRKSQSDISAPRLEISVPPPATRPRITRNTPAPDRKCMRGSMMPHLDRMLLLCDQYKGLRTEALKTSGHPERRSTSKYEEPYSNPLHLACGDAPVSPKEKIVLYVGDASQNSQTGRSPAENMENRRTQESRLEADSGRMRRGRREPAQISRKTTVAAGRIRRLSCR